MWKLKRTNSYNPVVKEIFTFSENTFNKKLIKCKNIFFNLIHKNNQKKKKEFRLDQLHEIFTNKKNEIGIYKIKMFFYKLNYGYNLEQFFY